MGEFQLQLLTLLGAIICLVFLVKCIWFLKYFIPYIWSILPPSFFQSMGEWAGKGTFLTLILMGWGVVWWEAGSYLGVGGMFCVQEFLESFCGFSGYGGEVCSRIQKSHCHLGVDNMELNGSMFCLAFSCVPTAVHCYYTSSFLFYCKAFQSLCLSCFSFCFVENNRI